MDDGVRNGRGGVVSRKFRCRRKAICGCGAVASVGAGHRDRGHCTGLRTWDLDGSLRVEADRKRLRQARWSRED